MEHIILLAIALLGLWQVHKARRQDRNRPLDLPHGRPIGRRGHYVERRS